MFLWASAGAGVHEAGGGPWRIRFPLRFPSVGVACGVSSMNIGMRFALVLLFALGMDPLCSLVGFSFLVGGFVAGCGFILPLPPSVCSPMVFRCLKSTSTGGLGWWILRLFHVAEAAGGGFGSAGFDLGFGSGRSRPRRSNGMTELGKMNRSSLGSFVIFLFFRVLFVKLGLYCSSI